MPKWSQSATITSKNMFIRTIYFSTATIKNKSLSYIINLSMFLYHLSLTAPHPFIHRTRRQGDR